MINNMQTLIRSCTKTFMVDYSINQCHKVHFGTKTRNVLKKKNQTHTKSLQKKNILVWSFLDLTPQLNFYFKPIMNFHKVFLALKHKTN